MSLNGFSAESESSRVSHWDCQAILPSYRASSQRQLIFWYSADVETELDWHNANAITAFLR
jgi:hypothetical protein